MIKYRCGCVNEMDEKWGVLKNVSKCHFHHQHSINEDQGLGHYVTLCAVQEGVPQHKRYIEELRDPMKELGVDLPPGYGSSVLELGAGLGMYAPLFMNAGYQYSALEPLEFPAYWIRSNFDVPVYQTSFEDFTPTWKSEEAPKIVMAAHVFEHMKDSPSMIQKAFDILPIGGRLFMIVPDDTDQTNPDHYWFYTVEGLRRVVTSAGFTDVRITTRTRTPIEDFIYCFATK